MDPNGAGDINVREFPITDASCLQVTNAEELTNRLATVLGPAREESELDPICIIDAEKGAPQGVIVDFGSFGPGCRLSCNPDSSALELLPWINLLLPVSKIVPMHASAFTWKGEGVVVAGNAGSGKTGALLAAINEGAGAVGDECLWLGPDTRLRGLSVEMEIRADYFRQLPFLRNEVSTAERYIISGCDILGRGLRPFFPRLARKFAGRSRAHVQPDIVRRHLDPGASIDRLFLSEVHPDKTFQVYPIELADALPRLLEIQSKEFARQREHYEQYRDAHEGRKNEWMEGVTMRFENLLDNALRNTSIYIVEHAPSPPAQDLFRAITADWHWK